MSSSQSGANRRAARKWVTAGAVALAIAATAIVAPAAVAVADVAVSPAPPAANSAPAVLAAKPYMGWSSWSLQSTNYPGVNVNGPASWATEANILPQADVMAAKLKSFGYEYINVDAGWASGSDQFGRPTVNAERFPHGIAWLADYMHTRGLKLGIYMAVGLAMDAYRDGTTPIEGAPGCTTKNIVFPDLRLTNGWDSAYQIDYSNPCSQQYANSIANLFASWKIDFLKMDGVGPGSWKGDASHNNTADVRAWSSALAETGRPIQYLLSWSLSHTQADVWKSNSNGWRIDTDVECYCNTIVKWDQSVKQRFNDVVQWIDDTGPGHWNNLDALDVGVGEMDGLTHAERQTTATLWAIEAAPLYSGDDLTQLDEYGLSLLTNREVIAIDQAGRPARPVSQATQQQAWHVANPDGTTTVALFNLADAPAKVSAKLSDVGVASQASVRDVWAKQNIGTATDTVSATLPAHGSQLLTLTPRGTAGAPTLPTSVKATDVSATGVDLAWTASTTGKGSLAGIGYSVLVNGKQVANTTGTTAKIGDLAPSTSYAVTIVAHDGQKSSAPSSSFAITTPSAAGRTLYEAEDAANTLTGSAGIGGCSGCSGGAKVGNLGGASTLTFTQVSVAVAGDYLVTIGYCDGFSGRQGLLTVGSAPPVQVSFGGTNDNDWDHAQQFRVMLHLESGSNAIQFANPTDSASDIDAITL